MRTSLKNLRVALAVLLVVSAGLFALGTTIERRQGHDDTAVTRHDDASVGENGERAEGETANESAERHESGNETDETVLGINPESVPLTIAAVLASLLLAAAIWRGSFRPFTAYAVLVFGLVFAAGDLRELVHQLDESRSGLAAIAGALALMHLAISALALLLVRSDRKPQAEPLPNTAG